MQNRNETTELSPLSRRRRMTLRLVTDAMMVAVYVVLAVYLSFGIKDVIQISLSSLPILLCVFLSGIPDAVAVAFCGSLAEQLLSPYGVSVTTPLWMLPVILLALASGIPYILLNRRSKSLRSSSTPAVIVSVVVGELIFTAANTAALYLDGRIMGYAVAALTILLPTRLLNAGVRTVCTVILSLTLLPVLCRMVKRKD